MIISKKIKVILAAEIEDGAKSYNDVHVTVQDDLVAYLLKDNNDVEIVQSQESNYLLALSNIRCDDDTKSRLIEQLRADARDHFYSLLSHIFDEVKDDLFVEDKHKKGYIAQIDQINGETTWIHAQF